MTLPDQLRAVIKAAGIEFHMIMERVLYDSVLDVPLRESNIRLNGAAYELSKIFDDRIYWKRAAEIGRRVHTENGVQVAWGAIEEQLSQAT